MWARVVEFMLGCWLAISPFIFGHPPEAIRWWLMDWTAATATITFALLSYWHPTRYAHLLTCLVGATIALAARFADSTPIPPAGQNHILVGLLLITFGLVPNYASDPADAWTEPSSNPS